MRSNGCSKTLDTIPAILPNVISLMARVTVSSRANASGDASMGGSH